MNEAISRRNLLGAAAACAAAIGATAALSGCSGDSQANTWDGESILPMGSVIKLKDCPEELQFVVISRRPLISQKYSKDADGVMTLTTADETCDYALYPWPAGRLSDFGTVPLGINNICISSEQIAEVVFMGYEDDQEKEAQSLLESTKDSGTPGPSVLNEMNTKLISQMNGALQ